MNSNESTSAVKMEPIHIRTTLTAGPNRRVVAKVRDHQILMDVSKARGGEDAGPTPPECPAMARCPLCDTIGSPTPLQISFAQ